MSSWGMLAVSKSIQTPEQAVQFLKLILLGGLSTNPMNASLGFVSVGEVATPPEAREARGAGGGSTVRARGIAGGLMGVVRGHRWRLNSTSPGHHRWPGGSERGCPPPEARGSERGGVGAPLPRPARPVPRVQRAWRFAGRACAVGRLKTHAK